MTNNLLSIGLRMSLWGSLRSKIKMWLMKSTIDNPKYRRMLQPHCFADRVGYLDYMIDFYFKVMIALGNVGFKSQFRAQMTSSLQMMFTKGKSMRTLLNGYSHRCGNITLNSPADHTVLFTIVRAAYEQLCAFELLFMIPDTEEKRKIMENAYVAAAQVNRLKAFTEEALTRYPEQTAETRSDIDCCRKEIQNTAFFHSLTEGEKAKLEETIFKKGEYQIVFTKEGKMIAHVGWDQVRDYCLLNTDTLHGVYRYACNMAHPSYLGLIQFHEAYKEGTISELNDTALTQMIAIMSVYIMDFLKAYPEAKHMYDELDEESQFMVRMYSEGFRNSSVLSRKS